MPTFVALLRGINVGKAKRVPMESLRTLLSDLGYKNVRTLLNSGNAIFGATGASRSAQAEVIASAIAERFAIDVPVIVKFATQLDSIVNENPFASVAADHSRLFVAFTQDEHSLSSLKGIEALASPAEGFTVGRHAAYLHCATGIRDSIAGKALLAKHGKTTTTRNWATTLKLRALASSDA